MKIWGAHPPMPHPQEIAKEGKSPYFREIQVVEILWSPLEFGAGSEVGEIL